MEQGGFDAIRKRVEENKLGCFIRKPKKREAFRDGRLLPNKHEKTIYFLWYLGYPATNRFVIYLTPF